MEKVVDIGKGIRTTKILRSKLMYLGVKITDRLQSKGQLTLGFRCALWLFQKITKCGVKLELGAVRYSFCSRVSHKCPPPNAYYRKLGRSAHETSLP